ncbi:MAG TPA: SAF domain-containing protein, partial [Phycisphaerae bacterium]
MATSPSPPSSTASKLFLVVAVALGVLATMLAFAFINSQGSGDNGVGVTIVVAKRDIAPNTTIDPERDLRTDKIPARYASMAQGSLDWDSRTSYKGQRVNRDIKAGQPVLLADLAAVGTLTLEKPYF